MLGLHFGPCDTTLGDIIVSCSAPRYRTIPPFIGRRCCPATSYVLGITPYDKCMHAIAPLRAGASAGRSYLTCIP